MKLGLKNAEILAFHSSLVNVAAAATGGKTEKAGPPGKDPDRVDLAAGHGSLDETVAAINRALRFG